jgi:hypothetical protein
MYKSRERRSEAQLRVSEAFQPDLEVASEVQRNASEVQRNASEVQRYASGVQHARD